MHNYIKNSFEAKVATARLNGSAIQLAKTGFDVACMRFVETLRHLVTMLRHHSTNRQRFGSARLSFQTEGPSEPTPTYTGGYPTGQSADSWQDSSQRILKRDFDPTNSRLVKIQETVPSLVTT